MKAYLDSSVILRVILGQKGSLEQWDLVEEGVASALAEVECLRTLDRLRLRGGLSETELAVRRESVYEVMAALTVVEPDSTVLARASQPFPTPLGTLDAIHLATALLWREREALDLVFATHDAELALAARASGMKVLGV